MTRMAIKLKQLRPNPFRDALNYPIHREKIEMLKASIRTTGFWDNLIVRKHSFRSDVVPKSDRIQEYEVAYGHHRLAALHELCREGMIDDDFECELPVRNLDDATMIRIMAAENAGEYRVTSDIIDETVRVAREYIQKETKTPLNEINAADISQFLGGGWNEDKVSNSLQRLSLFDRGTLTREQVHGLSATAARSVQREVAKVERSVVKAALEASDDATEMTEDDRRRIRTVAQKVARHVAGTVSDHVRSGGSASKIAEKSLDAQVQMVPDNAPDDERKLSTIDAAARAVHAREFQRKIEMLMKYRQYMSAGAKHELQGTLKEVIGWSKQMLETMESE